MARPGDPRVEQNFLGFVDSGLPEATLAAAAGRLLRADPPGRGDRALVRAIREFRPHVMLTYDENGGYPHPDHVMTHKSQRGGLEAAGDPDAYPGCVEPGSR